MKAIFHTTGTAEQHKASVAAMAKHLLDAHWLEIDPSCKNLERLCFASDGASQWNDDALPFDPLPESKPRSNSSHASPPIPGTRAEIAAKLLGAIEWTDAHTGHCKCPGEHLHTSGNSPRDCMVKLDSVPTVTCFHKSCSGIIAGINHELRSQIGKAEFQPDASYRNTPPKTESADAQDPLPGNEDAPGEQDATKDHFKSDVGYGDAFAKRHAKNVRFCADEKLWLVFDDENGWRRDNTGQVKAMAATFARELYKWAASKAADMEPDEGKRIVASMAALGNRKRIDPALSFAACNQSLVVSSDGLDAAPFLVGVKNGVVDLRNGSFQSHRCEHLVTRRLAVNYQPDATAPNWERFLAEVQPDVEMREFLQRLSGYSLTGEIREHVLPFHFGIGANGKGTFLEHAILKLAGSYGAKLTNSLVYASDRGHLPHLELAELCGKRFALGEENAAGGELNERLLKAITAGDKVKGRFHYANFIEYFPTCKIALVGNHKPRIVGTDDGIWRRFLLVDWPIQIPSEKRDDTLKDKLAAEMSGILNWCIAGAMEWQSGGLNPPKSCLVATAEFREKSDVLVEFLGECFEKDPDGYCTKADTFAAYKQWSERTCVGRSETMSKRALGFQLINRGWKEGKAAHENCHCWYGWRVKQ